MNLFKKWRDRDLLPPRTEALEVIPARRAAQEAFRVARALRARPNEPTVLHAHTLADIYDVMGQLNDRVANLEDAAAVRGVAQAYERTLP